MRIHWGQCITAVLSVAVVAGSLECAPGSISDEIMVSGHPNTRITHERKPGDVEATVEEEFWFRGSAAVRDIDLYNVTANMVAIWGEYEERSTLQMVFYRDATPLLRQYIRFQPGGRRLPDIMESLLDDSVDTNLSTFDADQTVFLAGVPIGIFEHVNQCVQETNSGCMQNSVLREKARHLLAVQASSTIRVKVMFLLPAYTDSNQDPREDVVLEWFSDTHANASACLTCPGHNVFTPADSNTGVPSLCVPCGRDAVFFPGATPDVTELNVMELQREPRRRSCGEVEGNATHIWCNPYEGPDRNDILYGMVPYPDPWVFENPHDPNPEYGSLNWDEYGERREETYDARTAWLGQRIAGNISWPNQSIFSANYSEQIMDFHLISIGKIYDLCMIRLSVGTVLFKPVTLLNRRRDASDIIFRDQTLYWTFTNNTDQNNPLMGTMQYKTPPTINEGDGVATWDNRIFVVALHDSKLHLTRYNVSILSSNKTDVVCLNTTANGGRPDKWRSDRLFWAFTPYEVICAGAVSYPDSCESKAQQSTQTQSICSYRMCGYECHDTCVRDVQSPQCTFTMQTEVGFVNISSSQHHVTDASDATDFALAALLHDHHALAARMTPQKLEVIASDDSRVSVALARGPVCRPQMAWEHGATGKFVLTLPCRGLTWRGHSEQSPPRLGLLRVRATCEACPEGTFRQDEHATCQPLYADAGRCAATYAAADLHLDTSDAPRPVARWGDTNATNLRAVLAATASNCSCAPGSVVRYVPLLGTGEGDETSNEQCAQPTRFLACAQGQRTSTLPFWEPILTYTLATGDSLTRVRMCVPTSRAGPNPDTGDFLVYSNTPGFNSVHPLATPSWSDEVVHATPARTVVVDGGSQNVYIPRAEYPPHRGMLVEACTGRSVTVATPDAGVAPDAPVAMVYAPGVFLHVGRFDVDAHDLPACREACGKKWECLWFSYRDTHTQKCALGIGAAATALPPVYTCENDVECLRRDVLPPFVASADASAAVYVWSPVVSANTSTSTGTVCTDTSSSKDIRACPAGSVRKLETHGLCEECGRNRRPDTLHRECEDCPANKLTRRPASTAVCEQCVGGQFLHPVTAECSWCNENHERDLTNRSACVPCPLGEHRAADDEECRTCPRFYSGHHDRDRLGCARCDGDAPRCPCPAGWTPDVNGTGGCSLCPPGTAKPHTGPGMCAPCRAGLVAPQHGAAVCVPCARDRGPDFTTPETCLPPRDATPATPPTTCPPGYEVVPTYAACMPCGRGWYKNTSGTGPCLSCPAQIRDAVYDASSCALATRRADCDVAWAEVRDAAPQAKLHPNIVPRAGARGFPLCAEASTTADASTCECLAGHQRATASTCAPCAPGMFKAGIGDAENCTACPRGFFQAAPGQASCVPCPMGTHDPDPDPAANRSTQAAACQLCPANATTTFLAAHACVCVPGYTDHDAAGCVACAENTFQPYYQSGAACTPCASGTSGTRGSERSACVHCQENQHWDDALDQCMCNAGYVRNDDDDTASCIACESGLFRNSNMEECVACPLGEYAASPASTVCVACAYGTWAMDPAQAICAACDPAGTVFDRTTGRCSIECTINQYANASTSCENCPEFTYADNRSTTCTACGTHAERQGGVCACADAGWRNVTWDNHPLGHPMTSCVPPDSHCPESAEHQRVVAWRLHAVEAHNATEGPGCPREAFDIDFMPSGVDAATQRARYAGTHAETGETWDLAWSQDENTYTIHRRGGQLVAHFSAPGALREYVRWEDTPGNRLDVGLFWNCNGETVDVRPVVECAACAPGEYFARSMTMAATSPGYTRSEHCSARIAYFEGQYEYHGEWYESLYHADSSQVMYSAVYQHKSRALAFILNAGSTTDSDYVAPMIEIQGIRSWSDYFPQGTGPTNGTYDIPGYSVNIEIMGSQLNMVPVSYMNCGETVIFEITFHSGCQTCNASNETNHQGWRFGDEASRELYWEQDDTHNDMPWYLAHPTGSQIMALAYMHIPELGYATYAIVDQAETCWSPPSPGACALADLDAFYNMSHARSRRVNITQVYGDSTGLGHWQGRDTPVQLARCTAYECPRGMYALGEETPQYRLDCALCPPGTYDPEDSLGCADCPAGKYGTAVAQVDDGGCQKCSEGYEYQHMNGQVCSPCPVGAFQAVNGTENLCTLCEPGKYSNSVGSKTCIDCPAGKYGAEGVCTNCPDGKYQPNRGESECIDCERYCGNNIIKPISKQGCGGTSAGSDGPLQEKYEVGDACHVDGGNPLNRICCQDAQGQNLYCNHQTQNAWRYCALGDQPAY